MSPQYLSETRQEYYFDDVGKNRSLVVDDSATPVFSKPHLFDAAINFYTLVRSCTQFELMVDAWVVFILLMNFKLPLLNVVLNHEFCILNEIGGCSTFLEKVNFFRYWVTDQPKLKFTITEVEAKVEPKDF
jgi:hypothetical protein